MKEFLIRLLAPSKKWREEAAYILDMDPASKSLLEVYYLSPGLKAIKMHEKAKRLYEKGKYFRSRRISEKAKRKTGIEIHPGASLGKNIFIDHGSGVVIGETTIVGDRVTIYQGVSLASNGKDTGKRRHPKIGNDVIVGAGAKVVGPVEVEGGAKIGAGAVVVKDVPKGATAVGVPARIIEKK